MIPVAIHFWVAYLQKNLHLGEKDTLQEMDQSFPNNGIVLMGRRSERRGQEAKQGCLRLHNG